MRPAGGGHRSDLGDDRGTATVLAATVIGVTALLLALGLALGATVLARHRAEHAADFAALAAAADAVRGRDVACERARELAAANGARLGACRWSGWLVDVHVEVACRCLPSVASTVVGRARAGPLVTFATSNARIVDHGARPIRDDAEMNGAHPRRAVTRSGTPRRAVGENVRSPVDRCRQRRSAWDRRR